MQSRTVTVEIPVPQFPLEHACWLLVAAAIAADIATTQIGLQAGLTEGNPAARGALEYGVAGMLTLKAGAIGVGLLCRSFLERPYRPIVPVGLALPWLLAALWNMAALSGVLA
ncbi:DUF5658 family protein [Natrinema gari]|uniref:DUF5658 domain-containing protein n=1 Tax=Natrinema gari JCM 14663 TaxID=1230459 RepID=L9ZFN9_9EURY|nr:DUF5658 family protein [Natrinema gari]ELY85275.1 hypothetical protein C486_00245 [Natrinema gari JCM 14663]